MKTLTKILFLLLIMAGNYVFLSHIHVEPIEWNSFLPKSPSSGSAQVLSDGREQYLFCIFPSREIADKLQSDRLIERYIPLEKYDDTYLLTFKTTNLNAVLQETEPYARSGTSVVGHLLFKNFFHELHAYAWVVFPFVLMLLMFFVPPRIWLDIVLEMGLYLLALSIILNIGWVEINSASLLALIFLVIYALTLINYLYADGMDPRRLFFGIQISVVATMLSALFLFTSQFGLIHSFGVMMMVGLGVLHIYMNIRIYVMQYYPLTVAHVHTIPFARLFNRFFSSKRTMAASGFVTVAAVMALHNPLQIDLNILNILPRSSEELKAIHHFEESRLPTMPFVISVTDNHANFADEASAYRLIEFQNALSSRMSGTVVAGLPMAFEEFSHHASDPQNPNLMAQFLLAQSFGETPFPLWSPDRTRSDIIMMIPLDTPSETMREMLNNVKTIAGSFPEFTVTVTGKISDFDYFIRVFINELLIGFLMTLGATALFFWVYCRNIVSVGTILLSALFSLGVLASLHILFDKPVTILTLLNIILFAGLITDSLIQLFICFKRGEKGCERSILHPIFISNFSILICLGGMFFVGGMMSVFAFDLTILLGANLLFIFWVVPSLHRRYLRACSV